jgi:DNA transformation protein and related proteins
VALAVSADFLTYVVDQLRVFSDVSSRRMFGGVGLYADALFFALIANDTLYLKVDDSNRNDYVVRGCKAFRPIANDPDTYSMSYFEIPADVLEDPDELKIWARRSLGVAAAAAAAKARTSRKRRARTKQAATRKTAKRK